MPALPSEADGPFVLVFCSAFLGYFLPSLRVDTEGFAGGSGPLRATWRAYVNRTSPSLSKMLSSGLICLHVSSYSRDKKNTHKPPRTRRGTLNSYHGQAFPVHYNLGTPVPPGVHQRLPLLGSGHGLYPCPTPRIWSIFHTLLSCDRNRGISHQLSTSCKLS